MKLSVHRGMSCARRQRGWVALLVAACAFGAEAAVVENGGTYINGLISGATGTEVTVSAGWYKLDCSVTLDKAITLKGGTDDPHDTVLDAGGSPYRVEISTKDAVFSGFTVTNAQWTSSVSGGGIYVSAVATVSNCVVTGCGIVGNAISPNGGGIYMSSKGLIVKTRVENCLVKCTGSSGVFYGGGVGLQGEARLVDSEIVGNFITSTVDRAVCYGGGVYVSGSAYITNCLIRDNLGFHVGGGVRIDGGAIHASTIKGNRLTYSSWGGGLSVGSNVKITNCRIEDNHGSNGGGVEFNGNNPSIVDSLIINNESLTVGNSGQGAGALFRSSGNAVISNCAFHANHCTRYPAAFNCTSAGNSISFYDCWFTENNGPYTCTSTFITSCDVLFRNCLFARNTASESATLLWGVNAVNKLIIDSCSFVSNSAARCIDVPTWGAAAPNNVTNVFIRNTCVIGTANGKDYPTAYKSGSITNCTYCFERTGSAIPFGGDTHNVSGSLEDIGFADYDGHDYLIGKKSVLAGKGLNEDWMGDGRRKPGAAHDMGDGTFSVGKVMDWGVTLSPNNAHPRLYGSAPDIGCFEYWAPSGIVLSYR